MSTKLSNEERNYIATKLVNFDIVDERYRTAIEQVNVLEKETLGLVNNDTTLHELLPKDCIGHGFDLKVLLLFSITNYIVFLVVEPEITDDARGDPMEGFLTIRNDLKGALDYAEANIEVLKSIYIETDKRKKECDSTFKQILVSELKESDLETSDDENAAKSDAVKELEGALGDVDEFEFFRSFKSITQTDWASSPYGTQYLSDVVEKVFMKTIAIEIQSFSDLKKNYADYFDKVVEVALETKYRVEPLKIKATELSLSI